MHTLDSLLANTVRVGDCLIWQKYIDERGYGRVSEGRVHRLVCTLAHGPANGRHALHSCDVKACCNPEHLSWGSESQNMREKRDRQGTQGRQKLTREQIIAIRHSPLGSRELAKLYGVRQAHICDIRAGRKWPDVR